MWNSSNLPRRGFLATLGAVTLPASQSASVPSPPLLGEVRIGAEFFLNAPESRETVFHHFRRMRETGLTVARIFTIWDHVEHVQGSWDFRRYDWIYDAAEQNGIFVANTLCSEDPPGWMQSAPFYHQWRDLKNPVLRPFSEIYLERVIRHYRDHPAHGVWLLQNEPGIREQGAEPFLLAEFAEWLEKKYGTVAKLNERWYTQLKRFSEAAIPQDGRAASWSDYPSQLDWRRFRCDHLADQLAWLRQQVEKHHPGALTHINPPGLTSNMPGSGRDMWKMKPAAHFLGASMHASWHFGMFPRQDFGVAYGFCCDLIRSVSAPAPWWVTELQAGPTLFTGSRPLNPTSQEITKWLWDGIGNGARGIVFWLWHPRTEGNEAGEWGLAGQGGEETERTRATRAVAEVLARNKNLFANARPRPAKTAILYSRDTFLLAAVDAWRRPSDEVTLSLMGCYKALHRAHVPCDFLDTSELDAGAASRYRVLYLPYCYALSRKSCEMLREFVRGGGVLWADGVVGWKDEEGVTARFPPGPLADVFGFTLEDIRPEWEPFELVPGDGKTGELWRCLTPGGKPIVERSFGQGRVIYFATALTLGYLRRENPRAAEWIARPAVAVHRGEPIQLGPATGRAGLRVLDCEGGHIVVLTNWGPAMPVALRMPAGARVTDLLAGRPGMPAVLGAGATAVLRVQLQ